MDTVGRERLSDQRHDALGVDHVGGQEDLHVPGDRRARLLGLPAERGAHRLATFATPSARRSSASSRSRWAPVIAPGTLRLFALAAWLLSLEVQLVELDLDVERGLGAGA